MMLNCSGVNPSRKDSSYLLSSPCVAPEGVRCVHSLARHSFIASRKFCFSSSEPENVKTTSFPLSEMFVMIFFGLSFFLRSISSSAWGSAAASTREYLFRPSSVRWVYPPCLLPFLVGRCIATVSLVKGFEKGQFFTTVNTSPFSHSFGVLKQTSKEFLR